ncbi:MAG: ATP-binding protein [Armatimonadetes bacterium]|nr:ATP-binding protein [Armatimonadota bacterium]
MNSTLLPRHVQTALADRLRVMPAVVVTGARQTGKSTLVQALTPGERRFFSLDDLDALDLARRDPEALVGGAAPVTLDEVQREPGLLSAVKRAIDRRRGPGQFLLTGSANLLLMRQVSESLAGRASYLTLWPMTRREQRGMGRCGLWERLLAAEETEWLDVLRSSDDEPEDWRPLARRGGFPTPAIHMKTAAERTVWFEGYVRTYLERDLQILSAISALPDFRRLMRGACLRLGQIVNQTELARDVALPQPTAHRYLNLIETSFLLVRVPAYAVNRTKRLIKAPKLYWGDTGLALHLAGSAEPTGAHLENLVLNDLLCWRDARPEQAELLYWRTTTGEEVDFVVEASGRLLPIEVKATPRPRLADAAAIRAFRAEYGRASRAGVLLHTGTRREWLTPDVLAAPWWSVC